MSSRLLRFELPIPIVKKFPITSEREPFPISKRNAQLRILKHQLFHELDKFDIQSHTDHFDRELTLQILKEYFIDEGINLKGLSKLYSFHVLEPAKNWKLPAACMDCNPSPHNNTNLLTSHK